MKIMKKNEIYPEDILDKYLDEMTTEASEIIDRLLEELKLIQKPHEK